jgi:hypothetical protein
MKTVDHKVLSTLTDKVLTDDHNTANAARGEGTAQRYQPPATGVSEAAGQRIGEESAGHRAFVRGR